MEPTLTLTLTLTLPLTRARAKLKGAAVEPKGGDVARHAFFTIANAKKTTATRAGAARASSGKDARTAFFAKVRGRGRVS